MKNNQEINQLREDTRTLFQNKFGDIVFDEGPHKYYIDGKEYTPVSHIISQYENKFDLEARSLSYAKKTGMEQDEVKRMWKLNNLEATVMGTRAHEYGESLTNMLSGHTELICQQNKPQYISDENWLIPTFPQEFAMRNFYNELNPSIVPIGAEFKLSTKYIDGAKPICGTADILFYFNAPDNNKSGFIIGDWKGLDINTPIFTADGWKTMYNIQVGDIVYDKDGNKTKVLHTSGIHHRKCYRITFDNKEEIISDNEHRWLITFGNDKHGYKEVVMTTDELYENSKSSAYKIPKICNSLPIQNDKIALPIDPYVFGVWLGYGDASNGKIEIMDKCICGEIKSRGYRFCEDDVLQGGHQEHTKRSLNLYNELMVLDVLNNKHIPDIFIKSSISQRIDLLRGLMDTNGYYDKDVECFGMWITQYWQIEAFSLILSSLGIKPLKIKSDVVFNCTFNPFLCKHKELQPPSNDSCNYRIINTIEEIESVPTRCIEVDSPTHTFLCGKNFLVTHNTNRDLSNDYIRNTSTMMKPPFDDYYDEALSHYYLQFNIYQRMMESIGLKIIARRLIHVKRDGTYEIHTVPKLDNNIIDQVILA